jgi:hypothetical protein
MKHIQSYLLPNPPANTRRRSVPIIIGSFGLVVADGLLCRFFAETLGEGLIILSLSTLAVLCGVTACQQLMGGRHE